MKIEIEGMEVEVGSVTVELQAEIRAELPRKVVDLLTALNRRNATPIDCDQVVSAEKRGGKFSLSLRMFEAGSGARHGLGGTTLSNTQKDLDEAELYATAGR